MPNWCENALMIYGKKELIEKLIDETKDKDGEPLSFEKILPMPENKEEAAKILVDMIDKKQMAKPFLFLYLETSEVDSPKELDKDSAIEILSQQEDLWYAWNNIMWNTKWDSYEVCIQHLGQENSGETECIITFETAWSPPIGIVEELAKRYPELTFRLEYAEPGVFFAGYIVWEKGRIIDTLEGNYDEVGLECINTPMHLGD